MQYLPFLKAITLPDKVRIEKQLFFFSFSWPQISLWGHKSPKCIAFSTAEIWGCVHLSALWWDQLGYCYYKDWCAVSTERQLGSCWVHFFLSEHTLYYLFFSFFPLKSACIIMILLLRNYYYFYESLYLGLAKGSHQTSTLSSSAIGREHYLLLFLLSISVLISILIYFPCCLCVFDRRSAFIWELSRMCSLNFNYLIYLGENILKWHLILLWKQCSPATLIWM